MSTFSDAIATLWDDAIDAVVAGAAPSPADYESVDDYAAALASYMATEKLKAWKAGFAAIERYMSPPRSAEISASGTQSGVSVGTAVTWNQSDGSLFDDSIVSLSSNRVTIAQDSGRFWIQLQLAAQFNSSLGAITFQLRDPSNSVITSISGAQMQTLRLESDSSVDRTDISTSALIVDTSGADVEFDVDVVSVNNLSSIFANRRILIMEVR